MKHAEIEKVIREMTLEEKAGLCSGADMWHTKAVERLGVKKIMVSDGPHGLRTQHGEGDNLGINGSISAVCFPAACATAASFDRALLRDLGETLGDECVAEGVSVLLGPAVNIKRTPLCGRNFEYFSEDPYLSGELAAEYVKGVQSRGVGVSVKHFAMNNQETDRMVVSADADERTMREIYLAAFEKVVKEAKPFTMMCSYNRINGEYASQNKWLLTDVLRKEWGFDGLVMSDWGAVVDRVKALAAGLDLEMPGGDGTTDKQIVAAVKSGALDEKILDEAVRRLLCLAEKCAPDENKRTGIDFAKDRKKAAAAAGECLVLLKNEEGLLPLDGKKKIAFIGEFAEKPRFQGGGSSHIRTEGCVGALKAAEKYASVVYERGYSLADEGENGALLSAAVAAAKEADAAVLFIGLPDAFESEGYDRDHMRLPASHDRLVREIAAVQKNTAVVLHNGSPVEMPWIGEVKAVLEAYLGGEGVGEAVAAALFGRINPSGKLPETFPKKLSDNPSYLTFPGKGKRCAYAEGVYVGYRYYDKKEAEVLFPFGHGLSYTEFSYGALAAEKIGETEYTVRVNVKNTGKTFGKEAVQLYIEGPDGMKELKGFEKLALQAGEEKTAVFALNRRSFAHYDENAGGWIVAGGRYKIFAGSSSRDLRAETEISFAGGEEKLVVNMATTLGELYAHPLTRSFVEDRIASLVKKSGNSGSVMGISLEKEALLKLVSGVPLRGIISMMKITVAQMEEIIAKLNALLGNR